MMSLPICWQVWISDKVLRFHASQAAQQRLEILLEKNKAAELIPLEEQELEKYMAVEHIVRLDNIIERRELMDSGNYP